jgi:hypothetical protein
MSLQYPPDQADPSQMVQYLKRHNVGFIAGIAQLVEHNLAKVGVAGSSPVSRLEAED